MQHIKSLIIKSLKEGLTRAEEETLNSWALQSPHNRALIEEFRDPKNLASSFTKLDSLNQQAAWQRINAFSQKNKPVNHNSAHRMKTAWFRYAAILLLLAGTATYLSSLLFKRTPEITKTQTAATPQDIAPGGNRAILTLADGSTIVLDSAANGAIADQGNTRVLKLNAGSLAYSTGRGGTVAGPGKVLYNTITTPKGGQYQIVLPDGSKVWLNAASSVTFPTAFIKDRKITATGEVYLEIANDKTKPFIVTADHIQVEVLGTSFNVNSYTDESSIRTTLLKGSIKVAASPGLQPASEGKSTILKPGQQAVMARDRGNNSPGADQQKMTVQDADIQQTLAWKNGVFNFQDLSFQAAARQLERWYDIEVIYEGKIPNIRFKGDMDRGINLSGIVRILTALGIKTRMEGRQLIVL